MKLCHFSDCRTEVCSLDSYQIAIVDSIDSHIVDNIDSYSQWKKAEKASLKKKQNENPPRRNFPHPKIRYELCLPINAPHKKSQVETPGEKMPEKNSLPLKKNRKSPSLIRSLKILFKSSPKNTPSNIRNPPRRKKIQKSSPSL